MSGSQANSVALKPGGTFSGGKRFSVRARSGRIVAGPRGHEGPGRQEETARAVAREDLGIIHGPHDRGAGSGSLRASGQEFADHAGVGQRGVGQRAAADRSCRRSTATTPRKQHWAVNAYRIDAVGDRTVDLHPAMVQGR